MIRSRMSLFEVAAAAIGIAIGGVAACGTETVSPSGITATLELPEARDARVSVTPALDVSSLYDASIADRIVIEEITINLADARLLGADPRVPAGGLDLLRNPRIVAAYGSEDTGVELPFPEYLLAMEDLAVYVRIDQAQALDGASVIVRGRVYAHPVAGGKSGLTSQGEDEAQDPDGEPAKGGGHTGSDVAKKDGSGSQDPDGEPANCGAQDPDGEPARPRCRPTGTTGRSVKALTAGVGAAAVAAAGESIPFELRGEDVADLVASLGGDSTFDVVVGIPAARWFTQETMAAIDHELAGVAQRPKEDVNAAKSGSDPYIVETRASDQAAASSMSKMRDQGGEYFLSDDPNLGRGGKVRRD